jgi:hypothetical protein
MKHARIIISSLALFLLLAATLQAEDALALRRWAIIGDAEVTKAGISDLLAAKLAATEKLELVEREQLEMVLKELELATLLGPSGNSRLRLGKVLKADALVLLTVESAAPAVKTQPVQRFVRLVIADCHHGARLRSQRWPLDAVKADGIADAATQEVNDVRLQFAGGIRQMVAVPPLRSKSLAHDYDALQLAYATMVQNALLTQPGVAVLETEEARQIVKERRDAVEREAKLLPLAFVEGDFVVETKAGIDVPQVRFAIEISGLDDKPFVLNRDLPLQDAADFLASELPGTLLERFGAATIKPLPAKAQQARLLSRADAFADIGDWVHAADLREAALLFEDDADQRVLLVTHYYRDLASIESKNTLARALRPLTEEVRDRFIENRRNRWLAMVGHVERIITAHAVNPREADRLVVLVVGMSDTLASSGVEPWRKDPPEVKAQLEKFWEQPRWPDTRERLGQFFRTVYPHFSKLDPALHEGSLRPAIAGVKLRFDDQRYSIPDWPYEDKWSAQRQSRHWQLSAACNFTASVRSVQCTFSAVNGRLSDGELKYGNHEEPARALDLLFWYLTNCEYAPFEAPVYVIGGRAEVTEVAKKLEATREPSLMYAGGALRVRNSLEDLSLALHNARSKVGASQPIDPALLAHIPRLRKAADQLEQLLKDHDYRAPEPTTPPPYDPYRMVASTHENALLRWEPLENLGEYRRRLDELESRYGKPVELAQRPQGFFYPSQGDKLEQMHLVYKPVNDVKATWAHIQPIGKATDLMWDAASVKVMREPGKPEEIYQAKASLYPSPKQSDTKRPQSDFVTGVQWDGETVWLATQREGLRVLSLDGETLATVDDTTGLPPYHKVMLHALSPGKCLACGVISKKPMPNYVPGFQDHTDTDLRLWFAMVERKAEGNYAVDIFHTATKPAWPPVDSDDDPEQSFWPTSIISWTPKHAKTPVLLLSRTIKSIQHEPRRPMVIDPETWKVSIAPGRFPREEFPIEGNRLIDHGGNLFLGSGRGFEKLVAPEEGGDWKRIQLSPVKDPHWYIIAQPMVHHQGIYYMLGVSRLDPRDESVEKINSPKRSFKQIGNSAHYGMVAWNDTDYVHTHIGEQYALYQIVIAPEVDSDEWTKAIFAHIPDAQRAKHAAAIKKLYDLGARVRVTAPSWIELGPEFKGTDQDLAALGDVVGLTRIAIDGAPIDGTGLENLTDNQRLELVTCTRVRLKPSTLRWLAKLPSLRELMLDGVAGSNDYTDDDLQYLAGLNVPRLLLHGPKITDGAVEHLKKLGKVNGIWLSHTNLTPAAASALKGTSQVNIHP